MMAPDGSFLEYVGEQAIRVLARGNEATGGRLQALFHDMALPAFRTIDHFAQFGLLPLCVALLIVHEHHRATTEGGSFRVMQVLGRTGAIVALVLSYDKVCGLITGVAGAGGGWMSGDDYLRHVDGSSDALGTAWDNLVADDSWDGVNWDNVPKFLAVLFIWLIVMITALFAFVASKLLAMSQAVLMTLIAGVGKTCLVVSIVPGVGIGKSWAKSLAQVAAWSTVAGLVTALILGRSADIQALVAQGELFPLLEAAAEFIIVGACTLAVPLITARIMAGGGHAATGAAAVLAAGYAGAKLTASSLAGQARGEARGGGDRTRGEGEPSPGNDPQGGGRRPHKAPMSRGDRGERGDGRSKSPVAAADPAPRRAHRRSLAEPSTIEQTAAGTAAAAADGARTSEARGHADGAARKAAVIVSADEAVTPPWRPAREGGAEQGSRNGEAPAAEERSSLETANTAPRLVAVGAASDAGQGREETSAASAVGEGGPSTPPVNASTTRMPSHAPRLGSEAARDDRPRAVAGTIEAKVGLADHAGSPGVGKSARVVQAPMGASRASAPGPSPPIERRPSPNVIRRASHAASAAAPSVPSAAPPPAIDAPPARRREANVTADEEDTIP